MVWEYKAIEPQYKVPENPLKGMLEMIANGQKAFDKKDTAGLVDPRDPTLFDAAAQASMSVEDKMKLLITLERENLALKDQTELEKQILSSSAANIDILKAGIKKGEAD